MKKKKKCLIYVVAYNHENFILKTLQRIPKEIFKKYKTTILVSDDFSKDRTSKKAKKYQGNYLKIIYDKHT